jgi:hypothetical protein
MAITAGSYCPTMIKSTAEPEHLELAVVDRGVVAQGSPSAVARFSDHVRSLVTDGRIRSLVAEGLAVAEQLGPAGESYREYFEFSPQALEALKKYDAIPAGDGWWYGSVRDQQHIVANLDWRPVEVAADQALSMQAVATSLALQTAVRDIQEALRRIEGKVDQIVALVRAERLGSMVGDQRTLQPLVEDVRRLGTISATDWSTVDLLGALIARDIEALRDYIRRQTDEATERGFTQSRSDALGELAEDLVGESLALLVLAEDNLLMWHELKLAREATESKTYAQALSYTQGRLAEITAADQALLNDLTEAAGELMEPTGWEGLRLLERQRLSRRGADVARSVAWFAAQRNLDLSPLSAAYPSTRESIARAGDKVLDLGRGIYERGRDHLGPKDDRR